MDIINFMIGVASGLTVNLIWIGMKEFVSLGPMLSKNPDIRGKWIGEYLENGKEIQEEIEVTKQFLRYIHGNFISHENGQLIKYKISGEFVYHNNLIVKFMPVDNKVTDVGVAMFEISNDGNTGIGASISINFKTKDVESRQYTMLRV